MTLWVRCVMRGWDHPREYGENPHIRLSRHPHQGSSPRIRGESFCGGDVPVEVGIIPANTGRIHVYVVDASVLCGSSPRIRGEWLTVAVVDRGYGIIPANTGRIMMQVRPQGGTPDHPREYGENKPLLRSVFFITGSSPRIRGE